MPFAVLIILILLPTIILEEMAIENSFTVNATYPTIDQGKNARSGTLIPVFKSVLRTLPTEIVVPDQNIQPTEHTGLSTSSSASPATLSTLSNQNSSFLSLGFGFKGLNQLQSCSCAPPDVQLAAGPSQLVEMVNLEGAIYDRQGITNQTFGLSTFFRTGTDSLSDPKILFDDFSGRWFASLLDITSNSVLLGVSSTNDAGGQWTFYSLSAGTNIPDQPILGISDDKVALASNDFSGNIFVGSQYWILNKSQLLAGVNTNFVTPGADSAVLSIHPVQSLSSTKTQYMISNVVSHRILSTTSLRLYSVTGVPGVSAVSAVTNTFTVSTIGTLTGGALPGGAQPGTSATIDTADIRVQTAVWFKGATWLGINDACTPTGESQVRSCIRLEEITTNSTPVVNQDFDLGLNQTYVFYPALSIDKNGNLVAVYGYSSAKVFPSLAVTSQLSTGPANSLTAPISFEADLPPIPVPDTETISELP